MHCTSNLKMNSKCPTPDCPLASRRESHHSHKTLHIIHPLNGDSKTNKCPIAARTAQPHIGSSIHNDRYTILKPVNQLFRQIYVNISLNKPQLRTVPVRSSERFLKEKFNFAISSWKKNNLKVLD